MPYITIPVYQQTYPQIGDNTNTLKMDENGWTNGWMYDTING